MQSPLAHRRRLERVELEPGLTAFRCPETGGHWIPGENYWRWRSSLPAAAVQVADESHAAQPAPVSEFDDALKLCPESGTVMTRYRVGYGQSFRVERSSTGGIWLDGGEWEALCGGQLQNSLHLIFTAPWQKAVRQQGLDAAQLAQLRERLGAELLERLQGLRAELAAHPQRSAALAFLNAAAD
ncbi:hypothetical protein [Prosthecobacter sp.]|uniref:hypothetical protein n=1 Tax=Prosthecobacter sp. TaxID=1965333 RepID=UPI0037832F8C